MPKGVCDGCQRVRICTELFIQRRWSKEKIPGGKCCKDCFEGRGFSFPVVYWP